MNPPRKHFRHVLDPQAAVWKVKTRGEELASDFLRLHSGRPLARGNRGSR